MRNRREQITFGELLVTKRLEAKLSRAQLSRQTGISENSLVRYEKAGLEQGGQYPTGPKMAKLCFQLGIPAASAMWGCLSGEEFSEYEFQSGHEDIHDHPGYAQLRDQYDYLQSESATYREALRFLISDHEDLDPSYKEEMRTWIEQEVSGLFDTFDKFQARMIANGIADVAGDYGYASSPHDDAGVFDRRVGDVPSGAAIRFRETYFGKVKDQLANAMSLIEEHEAQIMTENKE